MCWTIRPFTCQTHEASLHFYVFSCRALEYFESLHEYSCLSFSFKKYGGRVYVIFFVTYAVVLEILFLFLLEPCLFLSRESCFLRMKHLPKKYYYLNRCSRGAHTDFIKAYRISPISCFYECNQYLFIWRESTLDTPHELAFLDTPALENILVVVNFVQWVGSAIKIGSYI